VLCDNTIGQNVIVEAHNGVPFCKTITQMTVDTLDLLYLEQKYETDGSVVE
jgi:hypothetical protein